MADSPAGRAAPEPRPAAGSAGTGPGLATPAITVAEITVPPTDYERAVQCLRQFGLVLLPGAIGAGVAADGLRQVVQSFHRLPGLDLAPNALTRELQYLGMIAPGVTPDFPELLQFARQVVEDGVARPILERYFGGEIRHDPATLRFRVHQPGRSLSHVPLHQDVSFTQIERSWINCWVPLTACGRDAPGLQLYPLAPPRVFPHKGKADAGYPMSFIAEEALAAAAALPAPIEPAFDPGDLLLFDGFCPHRTVERPGMTAMRLSFEFRYTSDVTRGPGADRLRTGWNPVSRPAP